jgi:hypothetical protein
MGKAFRNIIICLLLITLPSCYSAKAISPIDYSNGKMNNKIYGVETKDGNVINESETVKILNSELAIYVTDSLQTKMYKYDELQSITIKKSNVLGTALLFTGVCAGAVIIFSLYALSHIKIT